MPKMPDEVRKALIAAVLQFEAIYVTTPPIDLRMKVTIKAPGGWVGEPEKYFGPETRLLIEQDLIGCNLIQKLDDILRKKFPILLGNVWTEYSNKAFQYSSSFLLICNLYMLSADGCSSVSEKALLVLLEDLETQLDQNEIDADYFMPLVGVVLPDGIDEIVFDDDIKIQRLNSREVESLIEEQLPYGQKIVPPNLKEYYSAICIKTKINFSIDENELPIRWEDMFSRQRKGVQKLEDLNQKARLCFQALSLFSNGFPMIAFGEFRLSTLIPILLQRNTAFLMPFVPNIEIEQSRISEARSFYSAILANKNQQVALAIKRLQNSSERPQSTDGLIDAMIGLEALLTPESESDVSYRLSMNFAIIAPPDERIDRFKRMKELTRVRGKVVHGQTLAEHEAFPHAQKAREALKYALRWCLFQKEIVEVTKTSQNFWRDFVLLPKSSLSENTR